MLETSRVSMKAINNGENEVGQAKADGCQAVLPGWQCFDYPGDNKTVQELIALEAH